MCEWFHLLIRIENSQHFTQHRLKWSYRKSWIKEMWPTNPSADQPDHPPPYNWYLMRFFRRFSNISSLCIDHYYYYHFWRCYNHCGWLPPKLYLGSWKELVIMVMMTMAMLYARYQIVSFFKFSSTAFYNRSTEYRVHFHFLSYWSFYFSPLLSSAWDALIVRPQVSQSVWLVGGLLQTYTHTYIFTVACGLLPVDMVDDDDGLVFSSHNKIQLVCMSMVMPHWVATSQLAHPGI